MPTVALDEQKNRFPQKIMYIAPSRKKFENKYKTRYTFIKISFQDLQLGITRQFGKVILPINLTNKQVKKISKFINDYFNDKKE